MNNLKLYIFIIFSTFVFSSFAQDLAWLKNSTSNDVFTSHSFYTSTQYNNDFYFAGDFWKDLTIDGVNITIGQEDGNGFVIKMDENGQSTALWHLESDGYVRINKIVGNPVSGTLILTGYYGTNLVYNNEEWIASNFSNGFIMSIFPDGSLDWIKQFEPQSNVSSAGGTSLAIDGQGNIFVCIAAFGDLIIENQSFSFEPETSGAIIAKFNVDGDLLTSDAWVGQTFENTIDLNDMSIDDNDELVIVGSASGTVEIADSSYVFSTGKGFIIKKDNNLNLKWLKVYEGTRVHFRDLYIDETDLVLSLQYNNSINIDGEILTGSGSWGDMLILVLDTNAELKWVKNFILSENGGISGVYCNSITEWRDEYYIGGMYQGDVLHEGELILDNVESNYYQYPFILSMTKEGALTSTYDFVGSSEPGRVSEVSSNASHLLFGGDFSGQISIGDSSVNTINSALFYGALQTEVTDIEVINHEKSIVIYPTLSSDYIYIDTDKKSDKITLTSSSGILLNQLDGAIRKIDINDLPPGLYYLSFETDKKIISKKFIKK